MFKLLFSRYLNKKNMKHIIYIIALSSFIFSTACNEDAFTNVVEIDIPEHTPLIALSSTVALQDTSMEVLVSTSASIENGSEDYEILENATVNVYRNNELWKTLDFDPDSRFFTLDFDEALEANDIVYKLEATATGFETASAEQRFPTAAVLENLEYENDASINSYGERVDQISFDIIDSAGEDYYLIEAFIEEEWTNGSVGEYRIWMDTTDPLLEDVNYGNSKLLNDATFDGGKYRVQFTTWGGYGDDNKKETLKISLVKITKDHYLFTRSLSQYQLAQDNPFAEPVVVFDNIENGYGIFKMENCTDFRKEL